MLSAAREINGMLNRGNAGAQRRARLAWLVEEMRIAPDVPVFDIPARKVIRSIKVPRAS